MLQYYDFTALVTGASFPVSSSGRFLYYLAGSAGGADNTIVVRAGNTGQSVLLKPGQSVRLSDADKTVDTWFVSNYAKAQPIAGQLLVGDGFFDDNRISGSVEVIDGGKNRTLAATAFIGSVLEAPGAGNNTSVQLWNPAGSGKNLVLSRLTASTSNSGGSIGLYRATAALPTAQGSGSSKKLGAAASSALMYSQIGAAMNVANRIYYNTLQGGLPFLIVFAEPIVIPPGFGVSAMQALVNQDLQVTYEWYEENV